MDSETANLSVNTLVVRKRFHSVDMMFRPVIGEMYYSYDSSFTPSPPWKLLGPAPGTHLDVVTDHDHLVTKSTGW